MPCACNSLNKDIPKKYINGQNINAINELLDNIKTTNNESFINETPPVPMENNPLVNRTFPKITNPTISKSNNDIVITDQVIDKPANTLNTYNQPSIKKNTNDNQYNKKKSVLDNTLSNKNLILILVVSLILLILIILIIKNIKKN
jgi:hypothetical protein